MSGIYRLPTMSYLLSDIFIGDFVITQRFGSNPAQYAKFGLRGHNGIDFGCPTGTQIVSAADGLVIETGYDPTGYGYYIKVKHDGYLTLYAHLSQIIAKQGEQVLAGELIGLSGNTGNSTGAHLHFGVAPCDDNGLKTQSNNGYSGYIDALSKLCQWSLKNLTAPVTPPPPTPAPGANGDELRALAVLYKGIQTLRLPDGSRFGNLEGMANVLVQDAYPVFLASRQGK